MRQTGLWGACVRAFNPFEDWRETYFWHPDRLEYERLGGRGFGSHRGQRIFLFLRVGPFPGFLGLSLRRYYLGHLLKHFNLRHLKTTVYWAARTTSTSRIMSQSKCPKTRHHGLQLVWLYGQLLTDQLQNSFNFQLQYYKKQQRRDSRYSSKENSTIKWHGIKLLRSGAQLQRFRDCPKLNFPLSPPQSPSSVFLFSPPPPPLPLSPFPFALATQATILKELQVLWKL